MKAFLKNNGLSIAALALFALSLVGQALSGLQVYNSDAVQHGGIASSLGAYLGTGAFFEALFENWESEFLQMALFVILTKFLLQKGSSESKKPGKNEVDEEPRRSKDPRAPWPVRKGGLWLKIYERSLSVALLALFAVSFVGHAISGAKSYSLEEVRHGGHAVSALQYVATANFWFESLQNWQSEFFSVAVLVLLSIVLRERGSAQSKPVAMRHAETE